MGDDEKIVGDHGSHPSSEVVGWPVLIHEEDERPDHVDTHDALPVHLRVALQVVRVMRKVAGEVHSLLSWSERDIQTRINAYLEQEQLRRLTNQRIMAMRAQEEKPKKEPQAEGSIPPVNSPMSLAHRIKTQAQVDDVRLEEDRTRAVVMIRLFVKIGDASDDQLIQWFREDKVFEPFELVEVSDLPNADGSKMFTIRAPVDTPRTIDIAVDVPTYRQEVNMANDRAEGERDYRLLGDINVPERTRKFLVNRQYINDEDLKDIERLHLAINKRAEEFEIWQNLGTLLPHGMEAVHKSRLVWKADGVLMKLLHTFPPRLQNIIRPRLARAYYETFWNRDFVQPVLKLRDRLFPLYEQILEGFESQWFPVKPLQGNLLELRQTLIDNAVRIHLLTKTAPGPHGSKLSGFVLDRMYELKGGQVGRK